MNDIPGCKEFRDSAVILLQSIVDMYSPDITDDQAYCLFLSIVNRAIAPYAAAIVFNKRDPDTGVLAASGALK